MEQIKNIKIAMICHFSTAEVRSHLPLDNRKVYRLVRNLLRLPEKVGGYGDIALWDKAIIDDFRKREGISLYVISAHTGLKRSVVSFQDKNVHYSFVRCDYAVLLKHLIHSPKIWMSVNPMRRRVRSIVNGISPDLLMLVGAENAYISCTALGFGDIPTYVLCQTIYNNPERDIYDTLDPHNAYVERKLIEQASYFGVYCKKHYDLLRNLSPDKVIFKFGWPSKGELLTPVEREKKYDFVNFAHGMSSKKGFHDSIMALAIVKEKYPDVQLNLVGGSDNQVQEELRQLVSEFCLDNNVTFTPFFEKRSDMFYHIQQSRFAILPCKMDNIAGTMNQAMQLGMPLVVYETAGTPGFNKDKQCVLIAKHSDIDDLAAKMLQLLDNQELAERLKINALDFQRGMAEDIRKNGDRLVESLNSIVSHFHSHIAIPESQLFSD